jgi:hypothetical protein
MTFFKRNGAPVPASVERLAEAARAGSYDRRESLEIASAVGASVAVAYAMLGLPMPARPRHRRSEERWPANDRHVRQAAEGSTPV